MKILRISFKSFEKSAWGFFWKRVLGHKKYQNDVEINIEQFEDIIKKLVKRYKHSPYRKMSGYTIRFSTGEYRISYIFENNKLYFKLLVRNPRGKRFYRKTQLIIQNLHT